MYPCVVPVYPQPASGVPLGTGTMKGVPFPILLTGGAEGDIYFHAYEDDGHVLWDIFLWHPNLHCPMYLIRRSMPAVVGSNQTTQGVAYESEDLGREIEIALATTGDITIVTPVLTMTINQLGALVCVGSASTQITGQLVQDCAIGYMVNIETGQVGIGGSFAEQMMYPVTISPTSDPAQP